MRRPHDAINNNGPAVAPQEPGRKQWPRTSSVNGKPASPTHRRQTPLLWVIREGLKLTGTKFGCGTGLCGACMVHIDGKRAFSCQTAGLGDRRQVGHHDRRPVAEFHPSAAEGLARRAGAAMRLLPVRPDHERGRSAQAKSEADARRDRRAHEHQHLPLRHLSAHRARRRARRAGGLSHDQAHQELRARQLSRRQVMIGAAGLVLRDRARRPRRRARSLAAERTGKALQPVGAASRPTAPSPSCRRRPRWGRGR